MRPAYAVCLLAVFCSGCAASLINQRVLNEFTDALQEDNEAAFRRVASTRFEHAAMRSDTAFRDMEILDLPTGKLTVVESESIDDTTRNVVVSEEDGEKYQIRIVYDQQKGRWAIDDVMIRQTGKGGTRGTRSAAEVMDLLLTLREFLGTMKSGDREQILAMTDTELREPLEELPDAWLQVLIARVTQEYESEMVRRPEAQLNGSEAVVKLPATHGFMLMQLVRRDEEWLIRNVELHNRREENHPGSIRNQAVALASVTRFLRAYNNNDREALKSLSTVEFYDSSLRVGDYRTLPLPIPDKTEVDFQVRSFAGQFTLLLPVDESMYRFDLAPAGQRDGEAAPETDKPAESAQYVVRDLAIYDRRNSHQRTLSSAFTAPVRAELFMEALHEQNLPMLRQLSSRSLNADTWERLSGDIFALISLAGIPEGAIELKGTRVDGARTELQLAASDGRLLGVTMEENAGALCVSDVTFPHPTAGVMSLHELVTLQIPIATLASAWQQKDRAELQRACSMDFNRLVWSNLDDVPGTLNQVPLLLLSPVQQLQVHAQQAEVRLSPGGGSSVIVRLLKEHNSWVVDEVSIPDASRKLVGVRESLRNSIAHNILHAPRGSIQMAGHTVGQTASAATTLQRAPQGKGTFTMPPSPGMPPAVRPAPDVSHAVYVPPPVAQDGVMRFGPAAADAGRAAPSASANRLPQPVPSAAVPVTEIDGVMYFGTVPPRQPESHAAETNGGQPTPVSDTMSPPLRPVPGLGDLSQHPIDMSGR